MVWLGDSWFSGIGWWLGECTGVSRCVLGTGGDSLGGVELPTPAELEDALDVALAAGLHWVAALTWRWRVRLGRGLVCGGEGGRWLCEVTGG